MAAIEELISHNKHIKEKISAYKHVKLNQIICLHIYLLLMQMILWAESTLERQMSMGWQHRRTLKLLCLQMKWTLGRKFMMEEAAFNNE